MTADLWLLFKPKGILQRAPVSAYQFMLIKKVGDEGHLWYCNCTSWI